MTQPRTLIAFYSRRGLNYAGGSIVNLSVGNTETVAGYLAKLTGGDLFRIDTVKSYPKGYDETTEVARAELRQNARPVLTAQVEDFDAYERVFLGYPNWWGTFPMAVFTFLEAYDFSGKTILPFCTHEGSDMGRSEADIRKLCPRATVHKGLALVGSSVSRSEAAVKAWAT